MLVLSRKIQETVVVGGSTGFEHLLRVSVLEIRGGTVKLGFEVDASVPVNRLEVWERQFVRKDSHDSEGSRGPPVAR
jgi:carbon storage regulator CsrA